MVAKSKNDSEEKQKCVKEQLFPEVKFCDLSENTSSLSTLCDNENQLHNGDLVIKKPRKRLISNESSDSIASSVSEKKKPVIPDGGYGWVVVFASFCVSLIADGISFSFGLLYSEFLAYFKESKSKTAWIGSLFLAVPLLVGPIMSNLVDKYGCRRMTIIGGLLSSTGFALASICDSIEMLYVTFGIISGLGLGIGYVTAVVSIAFWFDKKRTFATGIGASGTGIGTFLYAPLTNWLIKYFEWRGATLILAGTMAHTCVFGALMRDPDWLIEENRLESRSQSVTTFSNSSCNLDEIKKLLETGANKEAVLDTLVTNYNTEANQSIVDPHSEVVMKKYRSELFLPTYLNSQEIESMDDLKSSSRRSLRNNKSGRESVSEENLLSISSVENPPTESNQTNQMKYLASVETLSPSEKLSTGLNTRMNSVTSIQTLSSTEELKRTKGFNKNDPQRLSNSRLSLNENLINKANGSIVNINKCRGNSLDELIENNFNNNLNEHDPKVSSTLIEDNLRRFNNSLVIPIPEGEELNDFNTNKHFNKNAAAKRKINRPNLKRNVSLKYSNYLKNIRVHRNSINYRGALLNTHRYRLRASSCPNIYRNSMTTIARDEDTWYDSFVDTMKSIFDFSLFLDLKFAIFNLSTFLLFIWYIIPYFYITEHMLNFKQYQEGDSAVLISIIGIFNTVGMVLLGFIGDRPWLNVNICYSICMVFCGLSMGFMPVFIENYRVLQFLCVIFGLTFASTFSFTPSILVSLVDLDDFTCAYGLVLLVQGVGSLIGPPLAGVIYDITQRWDDSFYAGGIFIAFSGVLSYIVELLERRDRIKKLNNLNSEPLTITLK